MEFSERLQVPTTIDLVVLQGYEESNLQHVLLLRGYEYGKLAEITAYVAHVAVALERLQ